MIGTELATIDGTTYVALPDGTVLPEQPAVINAKEVALTPGLKSEISAVSPHVRVINDMVVMKIREMYSPDEENKILRIALRTTPYEEFDIYNEHVEACRAWGKEQKAALGL